MSSPTLRQLEIFAQMVASGNITDCADTLGVPPTSIESDLRALEERLGYQLFAFDGGSPVLTAAGHKAAEAMALLSLVEPDRWNDVKVPEIEQGAPPQPGKSVSTARIDHAAPQDPSPPLQTEQPVDQASWHQLTLASEPEPEPEPEPLKSVSSSTTSADRSDGQTASGPIKTDVGAIETIAWTAVTGTEIATEPDSRTHSRSEEELLDLTHVAPDPVDAPSDVQPSPGVTLESDEKPSSRLIDETVDQEQSSPAKTKVIQPPHALAVRVVFAAQAPATFPRPTVVSLFAETPLPLPVNDPEALLAATPPPVMELQGATQQKVVVAAHPSVFGHFQDALTAFEQANPDVSITLELDAFTAMRAEPLLASGRVDIVYYYALGERERFESRYVWSESLSIFIGTAHPLAQLDSVTLENLIGVRPLLLGSRNGLRPILDNAMLRGGIDLWQPAMETDNLISIMTAVRDGAGYFIAFGPMARDFGKMEGIKRLPFVDPLPPIEVRQAVREDVRDDPVVASLAEYLFR